MLDWRDFAEKSANDDDIAVENANKAVKAVIPFIAKHEGYREKAYRDPVTGTITVGHGHTEIPDPKTGKMRPVTMSDTMSKEDSLRLVGKRVRDNAAFLSKSRWTRKLGPAALASMYDVQYNAGKGIFSEDRSPALNRKVVAGGNLDDVVKSEIPTYRRAGGRPVKGLLNRRNDALLEFWNMFK